MKTYIKPSIMDESVEFQGQLMGLSGGDGANVGNPDEQYQGGLGNSRRGDWGNLWGNDDE